MEAYLFAELLWSCDWSGCVGVVRRRLDGEVSESDGGGIQAGCEDRVECRFLVIFRLDCHLFTASASLCASGESERGRRSLALSHSTPLADKARDKSRGLYESTPVPTPTEPLRLRVELVQLGRLVDGSKRGGRRGAALLLHGLVRWS